MTETKLTTQPLFLSFIILSYVVILELCNESNKNSTRKRYLEQPGNVCYKQHNKQTKTNVISSMKVVHELPRVCIYLMSYY